MHRLVIYMWLARLHMVYIYITITSGVIQVHGLTLTMTVCDHDVFDHDEFEHDVF